MLPCNVIVQEKKLVQLKYLLLTLLLLCKQFIMKLLSKLLLRLEQN